MAANKIAIEKNIDASAATIAALQTVADQSKTRLEATACEEVISKLDKSLAADNIPKATTNIQGFLKQVSALDFRLAKSEERLSSLEQKVQELSNVLAK